jgi:hypothetical protein
MARSVAVGLLLPFLLPSFAFAYGDDYGDTGLSVVQVLIIVVALVVILAGVLIRALFRYGASDTPNRQPKRNLDAEADTFFARMEARGHPPRPETDLDLQKGETPLLAESCRHLAGRPARPDIGAGSHEVEITRTDSAMAERLALLEKGQLVLTDRRLFYRGESGRQESEIRKLASVMAHLDSFEAAFIGESKSRIFVVDNPVLWARLLVWATESAARGRIPRI